MIGYILGFMIGGFAGALVMALCVTSKNSNVNMEGDKWIPVVERLPEEPEREALPNVDDLDEFPEYIAMIEGASEPTVLIYAGNGSWYRDEHYYRVIAWMPLPESYVQN